MIYWCSCFGFLSFLILFNTHTVFQTLDYTTRLDHLLLQMGLAGSSPALFHNTWQIDISNSSKYLFFLLIEGLALALWPLEMGCCSFINSRTKLFGARDHLLITCAEIHTTAETLSSSDQNKRLLCLPNSHLGHTSTNPLTALQNDFYALLLNSSILRFTRPL